MSFLKRFFVISPVFFILFAVGCDEDNGVEPPAPPPQITVLARYSKNIDPTKGLQNNDVYDILIDSNGKTWFATASGVSRFNGTTSEVVFNQNNGLPNPKCRTLAELDGKLYVGTWGGGIGVYDLTGDTWSELNTDSGLVSNLISGMDVHDGFLYIATNAGVSAYDPDDQLPVDQRWDTYAGDNILGDYVSSVEVASTPRGREQWFGPTGDDVPNGDEASRGITVIREGAWIPFHYTTLNSGLPEPRINDIFYDSDTDVFWIALRQKGLAAVDVSGSSWTIYTTGDGLPSDLVYSVTKIGDTIWVGTQNGLAKQLAGGTFRAYGRSGGLPADRVRVVQTDSQDRLWLGFVAGGGALVNPASTQ